MSAGASEPIDDAEIVHEKPISGQFQEVLFGSDSGNTLWVKFSDRQGVCEWIGKFGTGSSAAASISKVREPDTFLIAAGGFGYLVEATSRRLLDFHSEPYSVVVAYDSIKDRFIVADGVRLRFVAQGKRIWASKRIALDGIRDLKLEGRLLSGLAVVGFQGEEDRFTLDLDTLEVNCPVDFSSWDNSGQSAPRQRPRKRSWWKFW